MISQYTNDDTIFVQIASYRDPELQHTLQDLFKRAKRPENIFVGICHQYDMKDGEDKHLFEVPFPRPSQIRIDEVDYRESDGVSWARDRSQKLWRGEKWTLMIDAHMRLKENWDEMLVSDIKKINKDSVILTNAYGLTNYSPKTNEVNFGPYALPTGVWFNGNEFRCCSGTGIVQKIRPGAGFCCGFIFGGSAIISQMIFDQYLKLHDEFPNVLNLFTRGGNIFLYNQTVVAHLVDLTRTNAYRKNSICDEFVWHLTNVKKSNNKFILDRVEKYQFGNKRTVRDYERFSGTDLRKKKIREYTKQCAFEEWQEVGNSKKIKQIFININN